MFTYACDCLLNICHPPSVEDVREQGPVCFCFPWKLQSLVQCLMHSSHAINICRMNGRMSKWTNKWLTASYLDKAKTSVLSQIFEEIVFKTQLSWVRRADFLSKPISSSSKGMFLSANSSYQRPERKASPRHNLSAQLEFPAALSLYSHSVQPERFNLEKIMNLKRKREKGRVAMGATEFESVSGYHLGPKRKLRAKELAVATALCSVSKKEKRHKMQFWGSEQKCFLRYRWSTGNVPQNCWKFKTPGKHLLIGEKRLTEIGLRA